MILGSLAEVLPADDDRWLGVLDGLVLDADWIFDHRADAYGSVAVPALQAIDGMLGPSFDTARRAALKFRLGTFLIWGTGQLEEAEQVNTEARRLFEAVGDRPAALLAKLEEASIHFARGNLAAWVPTRAGRCRRGRSGRRTPRRHACRRQGHRVGGRRPWGLRRGGRSLSQSRHPGPRERKAVFPVAQPAGPGLLVGFAGTDRRDRAAAARSQGAESVLARRLHSGIRGRPPLGGRRLRGHPPLRTGIDAVERQRKESPAEFRHGLRGDGGDGDGSPRRSGALPGRGAGRLRGPTVGRLHRSRALRPGSL